MHFFVPIKVSFSSVDRLLSIDFHCNIERTVPVEKFRWYFYFCTQTEVMFCYKHERSGVHFDM